jgi:hypothetical protein
MLWTVLEHFGPICMMVAIIGSNKAFAHRAHERRSRGEAQKLRGALIISVRALGKLYRDNLDTLAGSGPALLAGRNQINLLRVQLSRLLCLEQAEIEALWTASIAAEAAESAMGVAGKPLGTFAFAVPERGDKKEMLLSALLEARAALEAAEALLAPAATAREAGASANATVIEFARHALRSKRRDLPGLRAEERASSDALCSLRS